MYVNLQGDEPLMPGENVDRAVETLLAAGGRAIATLAIEASPDGRRRPEYGQGRGGGRRPRALFFALGDPLLPDGAPAYRKHLGIYAFRAEALAEVAALPPSPLELAESLEQLRWLEAGYTIWVGEAAGDSIGVDTPADLKEAERRLKKEAMA